MRVIQTKFPRGKLVRERYIVEDLLGQGGFGAVYRVRDRRVRTNVFALKELVDPNTYQRDSFAFECDILRRLDHPALPRVYRVFEDNKNHSVYMLMDYIEGPNLEQLRQRQPNQRFSFPQVMHIMAAIIEAVIYLHAQQPPIIHRDIKPSNIIVPTSGDGAVLVDFGIAKEYDLDATTTAIRHCSPGYGAPEQYVRGTSTQTDIYGLAATFYTLLTGTVPIDALYRITRLSGKGADPLEPANVLVPHISDAIADALQHAMAINSDDRFTTVEEFWEKLKAYPVEEVDSNPDRMPGMLDTDTEQSSLAESRSVPSAPDTPLVLSPSTPVTRTTTLLHQYSQGRQFILSGLLLLILLALGSGIIFGTTVFPGLRLASHTPVHVQQPIVQARLTQIAPHRAAPKPPTPTATPTPVPTTTTARYPTLLTYYSGNIHNAPALVDSTLSLSHIQQNAGSIRGYITLGPGLLGSGTFMGTVSSHNKIQFIVPLSGRYLPLLFQGQVQSNGNISGTYCSLQDGQCNYSGGGYGTWNVYTQSAVGDSSEQPIATYTLV